MLVVRKFSNPSEFDILQGSGGLGGRPMLVPQELVDQIIDHLCDDIPSLKNCSTTCTAMLPRSTQYIFRRLRITTPYLTAFYALVQASKRLAPCIREFALLDVPHVEVPPTLIHDTVTALPELQIVHFAGAFKWFPTSSVLLPPGPRRHLEQLHFGLLHVDLVECVLEMFASVGTLYVAGRYVDGGLLDPRIPGRVSALVLRTEPQFICAMQRLLQPSALTSLTLDFTGYEPVNAHDIDQFLQTYGRNLEHFTLILPGGAFAGALHAASLPSLEMCGRLVSAVIKFGGVSTWSTNSAVVSFLPKHTRLLRFVVYIPVTLHAGQFPWLPLARRLDEFHSLEMFELDLEPKDLAHAVSQQPSLRDSVLEKFSPRLRALLRFV